MRHQSHTSSNPSEPPRRALMGLLCGLPAPAWDDWSEWIDYGDRGITSAQERGLIDIATDLELLDADVASPEAWAPIHACRCLGQLRSGRAVTPLLEALAARSASDDWLMQDLPSVFATIGSAAVAPLVAFAADRARAMHARMTAVDGLGHIGRRHETERQACVDGLSRILEGFEHEEPELNAMVIDDLVELGAQEAAPLMRAAFEAERVDLMLMGDWEDVQIALGLLTERQTPRPPPLERRDRWNAPDPEPLGGWTDLDAPAAESLERVLSRPGRSWGPTSPRELEGFLFTVSCAPDIVRPSEWIEVVLGEGEPFEDEDEARHALGALVALCGIIQEGVNEPFFEAPDGLFRDDLMANLEEDAEVAQWSRGFVMGHTWLEELWDEEGDLEELVDEELGPLVFGLSFFSSRSLAERYQKELAGEVMSLEKMAGMVRMCWTGTLVDYAALGRTLFRARMDDARIGSAPARAEPRPGRNDPCPCNSGRKYKKCCGRGRA